MPAAWTRPWSEVRKEMGSQYVHRPGCDNRENHTRCDCFQAARLRRQQLAVPFPADEWATMLSHLAAYRKHPLEAAAVSAIKSEFNGDAKIAVDEPTQIDLVRKIAMYQELWSTPPDSPSWTRRAVILWTFETVYSLDDKGKKASKNVPGTTWRFLTALDPTSQSHQQLALITPHEAENAPVAPPRLPTADERRMSENLSAAWDGLPPLTLQTQHPPHASVPPYDSTSLTMLDPFSPGTSLSSSYPSNFDAAATTTTHADLSSQLRYLTGAVVEGDDGGGGDVGLYDDASPIGCDTVVAGLQGWDASGLPTLDSRLDTWGVGFGLPGPTPVADTRESVDMWSAASRHVDAAAHRWWWWQWQQCRCRLGGQRS